MNVVGTGIVGSCRSRDDWVGFLIVFLIESDRPDKAYVNNVDQIRDRYKTRTTTTYYSARYNEGSISSTRLTAPLVHRRVHVKALNRFRYRPGHFDQPV